MKRLFLAIVLGLLVLGQAGAQKNRDDLTPPLIAYTFTVLPDKVGMKIDLDVHDWTKPTLRVAMPNWAPGSYGIRRYGEQVQKFEAIDVDKKAPLAVVKIDHQTWSIETEGARDVRVSYEIPQADSRFGGARRAASAEPSGFHFQGPAVFLYVVGEKDEPVTCRYVLPEGWKVANGLLETADPWVRRTTDYDTFADCPTIVGKYLEKEFDSHGTPIKCVFFNASQRYDFKVDDFVDIVRKICEAQFDIFGSYPFPFYVFLFNLSDGGGGGGLEHLNSTSIGLGLASMRQNPMAGASVTSHEFFHLWNVKRFHPKTLGPFEYEQENYTGNLWVSEGWTSYYGDLTLARTGLMSREAYVRQIRDTIRSEWSKSSHDKHSVYWASRNVWHRGQDEEPRVDYYAAGEILGLLIDLKIRHETQNRKSLDDVMRFFNRWFADRRSGFEEADVERACTAISNFDFSEFFARHVRGTVRPRFGDYLAYAGIDYQERVQKCDLPFSYDDNDDGTLTVRFRRTPGGNRPGRRNEPAASQPAAPTDGMERGDLISALDGKTGVKIADFLATKAAGDVVEVTYKRGDKADLKAKVTLVERNAVSATIKMKEAPSKLESVIFDSWLTGR